MIPLRDINPRTTTPFITIALIAANALAFFYQLTLPGPALERLVFTFGMIPARVQLAFTTADVTLAQAFAPLLTSIFLHGGWMHLIGNMWFLWVFGDNIEDRLGHIRYLVFYLATGIGAGLIHLFFNWGSPVPAVGASGAISGVLGAYLILFPHSRVITLVPLLVVFFTVQLPAWIILGYWFVIQFVSGLSSIQAREAGGVAWWAHIGGFALGVVLAKLFPKRPRRTAVVYYE